MGAAPDPATARIGVAITTVGRWGPLRELLTDLAAQSRRPCEVAIAHHNEADAADLAAVVRAFEGTLDIRTVLSPRGISNGRNAAAGALTADADWLWFPNDTSRITADVLEQVSRHCVPPTTVVAVQLVDREGPRNPLPPPGSEVTRRTVWGAMEPATFFRREAFEAVGGWNPSLGSGAATPWQSGEGPDLLLRMSEHADFSIDWVPDIVVQAQTEFAHLPPEERRRKQRSYGRGAGYVLRTWKYPLWYRAAHLVAAALMPLRNPDKFGPGEAFALLLGRTEGLLGRPLTNKGDHQAILR
ncbi:hypothetical protein FHR72_003502 [Mycolicibacterium iranicum]|uniref:Glycosyltransferase n=1 Tax=Mycolicibacterium iranicum TaxID=912594 RepID=A0A839QCU2_MYCIR|nr:glycosyltransferase [Mycolicibacterium iranicum]MBB2992006.1 hypothetical protein [Mycolicibacterium iranicum]